MIVRTGIAEYLAVTRDGYYVLLPEMGSLLTLAASRPRILKA